MLLRQNKEQKRDIPEHRGNRISSEQRNNAQQWQTRLPLALAQVKADDRKRRLQNYRSLTIELRKFIRTKITEEQWSPAQIVGYLRKKGEKCVCLETIYAYIRADRAAGGDLWKLADISLSIGNGI